MIFQWQFSNSQHVIYPLLNSNNDINVLHKFNVFFNILEGETPMVQYTLNTTLYNIWYILLRTFILTCVKIISMSKKKEIIDKYSIRNDVEPVYEELWYQFAIICGLSHSRYMNTMNHIMYVCIIIPNMVVED